jgi:phosphoribosylaminoimidazolecarboxamide formyltransferase/IMP cyclohydrolase
MTSLHPKTALLSLYHKERLAELARTLSQLGIQLYASGGTARRLHELGYAATEIADLTGYPSILGGRVKTLHPAVFGGILANRAAASHQEEMSQHALAYLDMVVVDLYPFEATLARAADEGELVENIDIGGIALLRAAAKNFHNVLVVPYASLIPEACNYLEANAGEVSYEMRRAYAGAAFRLASEYDRLISGWLTDTQGEVTVPGTQPLRYGENPQQAARFEGDLSQLFEKLGGKALSYNNLLDIEGAFRLAADFNAPAFGIFKHTNPCGIAYAEEPLRAWQRALACDPVSAFGGIVITNHTIDRPTAEALHEHFYEILIAPAYEDDALALLHAKPKRVLLRLASFALPKQTYRTVLNGRLVQEADCELTPPEAYQIVTTRQPSQAEQADARFGEMAAKHLKSNAIAIAKDQQLIGAGVGQTSRIDALHQAIAKARHFGFEPGGGVLVSDGFFPFADGVEAAHQAGIEVIIQPGGSRRDEDSIQYCEQNNLCMLFTNNRHFRH